jgi:hypothetical protein
MQSQSEEELGGKKPTPTTRELETEGVTTRPGQGHETWGQNTICKAKGRPLAPEAVDNSWESGFQTQARAMRRAPRGGLQRPG